MKSPSEMLQALGSDLVKKGTVLAKVAEQLVHQGQQLQRLSSIMTKSQARPVYDAPLYRHDLPNPADPQQTEFVQNPATDDLPRLLESNAKAMLVLAQQERARQASAIEEPEEP